MFRHFFLNVMLCKVRKGEAGETQNGKTPHRCLRPRHQFSSFRIFLNMYLALPSSMGAIGFLSTSDPEVIKIKQPITGQYLDAIQPELTFKARLCVVFCANLWF